ncbi:unnamed protein product [Clavelina lepadiformis]|uniref:Amino acid transporter transmembrane domain-containing protein n=1 Tax=Clavelina lepadiformis TaxID=159417 RepID=A0ABP0FPC1_CLALP
MASEAGEQESLISEKSDVENDEGQSFHSKLTEKKRLSVFVGAVFIVGTMCGSGILAVPKALVDSGWAGIPLMIVCGLLSSYTGSLLGKCWTVLRKRYPEYEEDYIADPYPTIGFRAAGKWGKYITRICILLTLIGAGTVYLLLIAGNMGNLIHKIDQKDFHTCYIVLIVTAFLIPLTWLGTPKDFWQAAIIAAATSAIAGILIVAGIAKMAPSQPPTTHENPSFTSFFTAFGTILFAFGGASVFPTIQVDMKNPDKFPYSVIIGIMTTLSLYLPVAISGFIVFGDRMNQSNILDEMEGGPILYTVIALITSHLMMAYLIVMNPINQDLERFLGIEAKFGWKRCVLRSLTTCGIAFLGLSIPHFGIILSLVGGSTVTATNFVFPPLFYVLLSRQKEPADAPGELSKYHEEMIYTAVSGDGTPPRSKDKEESASSTDLATESETHARLQWEQIEIPLYIKILLGEIIFIGVVGGIASTFSIIWSLANGSSGFTVPCYVNWATADAY